ncbi:hypothetical protein [Agrobacterium vaccinii]|uniref:hypothetical protein n=1 Tax=Agrobacterium vaccinii TaxID=2735528 RepID=UPI001E2FF766|nr:hypothetical protein [Agrobacterium vaccinii]UHS56027.1 hypothetical protein HRS00_03965 [Agrobacterium vaccinii]
MQIKTSTFEWLFWIGIATTLSYILFSLGFSLGAMGKVVSTTDYAPMKIFLESMGLNLLGDTLSGVFAPATFLIVVITSFLQSRQVKQNIDAMAEQNRLAKASAQAQYKFALHDKRMLVYKQLVDCSHELSRNGTIDSQTADKIQDSLDNAKFVFGNNVQDWIGGLFDKAAQIRLRQFGIRRLQEKISNNLALTQQETDRLNQLIDEVHNLEDWFFNNLTRQHIDEMLTESLKLPDNIE